MSGQRNQKADEILKFTATSELIVQACNLATYLEQGRYVTFETRRLSTKMTRMAN